MNKKKFLLTIVLYSSFLLILFIFLIELFLYLSENRVDEKTMTVSLEPTLAPILPPPTIKPLSGPISSPTTIPSPTSNASSRRNKTLPSYIPKNLHKTIVIVCTGGDGYLSHCFFKNSKILESNNSTWHFYPSEDFVSLGNLDCFDWPFIEVGQCNGPPDREATFLLTMPDGNSVELPRYSYSDDDYIYTRYDFGSESQLGTYVISVHSRYGIFRKEFVVQNSDNANGVRFLNCKTKVDCEIKKKTENLVQFSNCNIFDKNSKIYLEYLGFNPKELIETGVYFITEGGNRLYAWPILMNEEGRAYEEFTIPLDAPVGQYLIRACSIERCVEDWRFSVVPGSAVNNTQFTKFTNLRFSNSRDGIFQPLFSAGTQEIYAVWDYEGMKEGDKITRRWYLNDKEPRTVEEDWNFSKYGSSGTVGDVYLYDYTDGLESGEWRVDLYLNDELQISGKFTIGE